MSAISASVSLTSERLLRTGSYSFAPIVGMRIPGFILGAFLIQRARCRGSFGKRPAPIVVRVARCDRLGPIMAGIIGPSLSHLATRTTIGAGLFPNDPRHLARWIKNAPRMKPGILMPTIGANEYDPVRKSLSL